MCTTHNVQVRQNKKLQNKSINENTIPFSEFFNVQVRQVLHHTQIYLYNWINKSQY